MSRWSKLTYMLWRVPGSGVGHGAREEQQDCTVASERTKRVAADPRVRAVMRLRNYVIRGWSARQYVRVNVIIKESITYSAARFGIPDFSLLRSPSAPFHVRVSLIPRRSVSPDLSTSDEKFSGDWMPDAIKLQRRTRNGKWPEMRKGLTFSSMIRKVAAARSCYVRYDNWIRHTKNITLIHRLEHSLVFF